MVGNVTLCVPTYNSAATLSDTIETITTLEPGPTNLIIVDGGSTDGTVEIAQSYDVPVVDQGESSGLSGARNVALDYCETEYLAMIDSDVEPAKDWLGTVRSVLEETGAAAATAEIRHHTPSISAKWAAHRMNLSPHSSPGETDLIPGANGCYRTKALRDVGGWNESYPFANEDIAVSKRLRENGYSLIFTKSSYVIHHSPQGIDALYQLWRWHRPEGNPANPKEMANNIVGNFGKSVLYSLEDIKQRNLAYVPMDLAIGPLHTYWDMQ